MSEDQDVTNPGVNLTTRLLPPGSPTEGLLCGYGSQSTLKRDRRLSATQTRKLAGEALAVPLSHPAVYPKTIPRVNPGGCGIFEGEDWILVFAYNHHPDVDLWLHPGCITTLDNGQITADQDGELATLGYPQSLRR